MRLSPADFWGLSPREWRWLAGAQSAAPARPSLDELKNLAALYPDQD